MRRALLLLAAVCLALPCAAQEYEISDYRATFWLIPNSADVEVKLDITYDIRAGQKSDGFKYTGDYEPVDARGTDDRGNSIPVAVEHRRDYLLFWTFPPIGLAQKQVSIRFRLRNVLYGNRKQGNHLVADWVGVFKVPVRRAVYEIVFPPGVLPDVPDGFQRSQADGREVFTLAQEPLSKRKLSLSFTPGIVDAPKRSFTTERWYVGLVGLGLLFVFVLASRIRSREGANSGGGCGGGGCGGGGCGGGGCGG